MKRKWVGLIAICAAVLPVAGCGNTQQLETITVTPSSVTFLSPATTLTFQLTAVGTYVHPPATKNLTDQVTWQSDAPELVAVTNTGVVSTAGQGHCGVAGVSASLKTNSPTGNVVVSNSVTVTVDDSTNPICPQP